MDQNLNIFAVASDLVACKAQKYFTVARQVSPSIIIWPLQGEYFLYIDTASKETKIVDSQIKEVDCAVTEADLWIVSHAMQCFSDLAKRRNAVTSSQKVIRFLIDIKHFVHNLNPFNTRIVNGVFSCEDDYSRTWTLSFLLRRALELGAQKLKLDKVKIVDRHIFFPRADDYLVLTPTDSEPGFICQYADRPEISALEDSIGIAVHNEIDIIYRLGSWISEVENS